MTGVQTCALPIYGADPVGLYLGTTSGEVWASADEGAAFACIARHLPHIYSVTMG